MAIIRPYLSRRRSRQEDYTEFAVCSSKKRPSIIMEITEKDLIRFWSKVDKTNNCWLFKTIRTGEKYGRFSLNGKPVRAHRFSFFIHYGYLPPDKDILHKCDNPRCVNPYHLVSGTHNDNMKDMVLRSRSCKGNRHFGVKLNKSEVIEIRELIKEKIACSKIAKKYNVAPSTIYNIKYGKTWNWL